MTKRGELHKARWVRMELQSAAKYRTRSRTTRYQPFADTSRHVDTVAVEGRPSAETSSRRGSCATSEVSFWLFSISLALNVTSALYRLRSIDAPIVTKRDNHYIRICFYLKLSGTSTAMARRILLDRWIQCKEILRA